MGDCRPVIAVTAGEPAGIGPELCAHLALRDWGARPVVIGSLELQRQRLGALADRVRVRAWTPGAASESGTLDVLDVPLAAPCRAGTVDPANARHVLAMLDRAIDGCVSGEFAAMVTAPVHKAVINEAGIAFSGHTEFLAELTSTAQVVMMLATHGLRVALVTTHLPLKDVAGAITAERLERVTRILHADLLGKFSIARPRILVCGLNPHAGEGGHLGREEIEIIEPTLARLRAEGLDLVGPLPADTLFTPKLLDHADAVLAMYHDQGLPVLKHKGFGQAVNVTLGLPIIRTSVDHGTALDLAATGRADVGSLRVALHTAISMIEAQRTA